MHWTDIFRLIAIVGMSYAAWVQYQRMPKATIVNGKRYYPQPDGSIRTLWGRRVRDPAVLAAFERQAKSETQAERVTPPTA